MNDKLNQLSERVIGCAIEVHKQLGPGLLESIYEAALARELDLNSIRYRRQHPLAVAYKGYPVGEFRIDLLVEDELIVELKAVERSDAVFEAQTLSYLKLSGRRLALLLNFNSRLLKDGIRRFINTPAM